ncbi:MAG: hypothetical protein ABI162_06995 [Luteolibacter sp.]
MILGPNGRPADELPPVDKDLAKSAALIQDRINFDRERWISKQMKKLLPNRLYCDAKKKRNLEEVAEYIAKEKISLRYTQGDFGVEFMHGDEVVAKWSAQLNIKRRDPKAVVGIKTPVVITDQDVPARPDSLVPAEHTRLIV